MKNEREIVIGGRYRHIEGTEYTVEEVILDATNYEETGKLEKTVTYTQQVAGHYPVGTKYARRLGDFLGQTEHNGEMVNKFELVSQHKD